MIRLLQKEDELAFISMATKFSNSPAVLHPFPIENITNTFSAVTSGSPLVECLICIEDNEPAGYMLLSKYFSNEYGGIVLWVDEVYVEPNFRGKGIGKQFFTFVKDNYSDKAIKIRLELAYDNYVANEVYIKQGFEQLEYKQMYLDLK